MVVRMTAGGGDRRTRSHQTGAPVLAAVDGVTDSLIRKTVAAYYTQGGKTGHQIEMRCLEALESPVRDGFIGLGDSGIGFAVHRKMYMAVAQAGSNKLTGEINDLIAIKFCFRSGDNGFNSFAVGEDDYIFPDGAGGGVEHFRAFDRFLCHSNTDFLSLVPMNRHINF